MNKEGRASEEVGKLITTRRRCYGRKEEITIDRLGDIDEARNLDRPPPATWGRRNLQFTDYADRANVGKTPRKRTMAVPTTTRQSRGKERARLSSERT